MSLLNLFITMITGVCHEPVDSVPRFYTSFCKACFNVSLLSDLRSPKEFFPEGFTTKMLQAFLISALMVCAEGFTLGCRNTVYS